MRLSALQSLMRARGCQTIYLKVLAANDNKKQQVYFGGDFKAINLIPFNSIAADPQKPHIFKAPLNFWWLADDGRIEQATHAQLILYPQYPEVRFSGFLQGCSSAPSELMNENLRLAGRVLFMGICPDGKIIGYLCHPDSELARELASFGKLPVTGVFQELGVGVSPSDERLMLIEKLREIHLMGWIRSRKLDGSGATIPCEAPNCGGMTLEAELGIIPNSRSEPDYLGYEVKQYAVNNFEKINTGVLTLMTPEPTGGYYRSAGVEAFIRKFGYPDMTGTANREDRLNFGGIHKVGEYHGLTNLQIELKGFDKERGKIVDATGGIALMNREGEEAAVWGYAEIMAKWNRKHNKAVYIPSKCNISPERNYYYGNKIRIGNGTDFLLYLKAMANGDIYYDPGIKLENASTNPKTKRRSQFRIKSANLPSLYHRMETVDVCAGEP